jgi:3-phytase
MELHIRALTFLLLVLMVSCSSATKTEIMTDYSVGQHPITGKIPLGGLSGLTFVENNGKELVFYSITDRGPNAKKRDSNNDGIKERPILLPKYSPLLVDLRLNVYNDKVTVHSVTPLALRNGHKTSGLHNVDYRKYKSHYDEPSVDAKTNKVLKADPWGIDPESIAISPKGHLWIGEEYGPSLLRATMKGDIYQRYYPNIKKINGVRGGKPILPTIFSKTKRNRGFEALALIGNNLYAFLQSPLPIKEQKPHLLRVLVMNSKTYKPKAVHLIELPKGLTKIGGATFLKDKTIAFIAQNGKKGSRAQQYILSVDFEGASNLIRDKKLYENKDVDRLEIYIPVAKKLINLSKHGMNNLEKIEGLTYYNRFFYLINDNDFNLHAIMNKKPEQKSSNYLIAIPYSL